ncbi:hypothetical protein Avbf_15777 [Armadillidium vulgare]|nr:hypothetical protein Avbf_15777 [Armadillidium vulgare]
MKDLKIRKTIPVIIYIIIKRNRSPFHEELRRDSVGLSDCLVCWVQELKIYRDIEGQREVTAHFKFKDGWIQNGVKMLHQEINCKF